MRIFLGTLMLFFASGEDSTIIQGFLDKSVCLPCNCSERIHDGHFRWQREGTNDWLFKYNGTYHVGEKYKKRVGLISCEESSNCSLLLKNIAAEDQGTYTCSYYSPGYTTVSVELKVSGHVVGSPKTHGYFAIIPCALMLGVFVYLCYRFRFSRRGHERFLYKHAENKCDGVSTLPG